MLDGTSTRHHQARIGVDPGLYAIQRRLIEEPMDRRWVPGVHRLFSRQSLQADVRHRIARLRVCLLDGFSVSPAGQRIVSEGSSWVNCVGRKKFIHHDVANEANDS